MALQGEAKKKYMKEYVAKRRAAGNPVPEEAFRQDIDWAREQDALLEGRRYLSEVLSLTDLALLFHGAPKQAAEGEEKKKVVAKIILKPSITKILGYKLTFRQWLTLRDVCRKDGLFLGKMVLNRELLTARVHQPVFDQFVQKNFDGIYYDGYTMSDVHNAFMKHRKTREKELLLLDPRSNLKSTIDGIDAVQWLLNVPDVRIFLLTGEKTLADAFLGEIKGYFTQEKGADPSDFHLLFPDYVVRGRAAAIGTELRCPARRHKQKEPSVWVNSLGASLSGWHCDIKKGDDMITDENCNTAGTRKNLKMKIDGTKELVDAWGFTDNVGTRYWTDDWYGERLKVREKAPLRYFCRACWTVKPGFETVKLKELTIDMVDIMFPERMTGGVMTADSNQLAWDDLQAKLYDDERGFRNQQLNEPIDAEEDEPFKITFDPDKLKKHEYGSTRIPTEGDIYVAWDWAYTDGKRSDLSVGVAGKIYRSATGEWGIVVLEVIFGHWKPSELAFQMIAFNKKWHPKRTLIEKTNVAGFLQNELFRVGQKHQAPLNDVWWFEPDYSAGAKRNRVKSLELLLNRDLLWFVSGLWLEITFKQLSEYKGENSTQKRKDDIPDAISFLAKCCPRPRMTLP